MQRLTLGLLATLAAALPFASHAETMDYSYVELGYIDTEIDNDAFDVDGDGFALRGSLAVHERFFVFAGYEDLGFERGIDTTTLQVGGGAHWPLKNNLDIVARAAILKSEVEFGPADEDDNGFLLGARLRTVLAPQFEVEGGIEHVDLDDQGDETSLVLEGRYFFIDQLAGGLLLQVGDDATALGVNVRLTF